MPARPKFYAVASGRQVGVFQSWDQVLPLVNGFPGAVHKSFPSREEAEAWLQGRLVVESIRVIAEEEERNRTMESVAELQQAELDNAICSAAPLPDEDFERGQPGGLGVGGGDFEWNSNGHGGGGGGVAIRRTGNGQAEMDGREESNGGPLPLDGGGGGEAGLGEGTAPERGGGVEPNRRRTPASALRNGEFHQQQQPMAESSTGLPGVRATGGGPDSPLPRLRLRFEPDEGVPSESAPSSISAPRCRCGHAVERRVAGTTSRYPGRPYYSCRVCNFFLWADLAIARDSLPARERFSEDTVNDPNKTTFWLKIRYNRRVTTNPTGIEEEGVEDLLSGVDGVDDEEGAEGRDIGFALQAITLERCGSVVLLKSTYNHLLITLIKSLDRYGRSWDPEERAWRINIALIPQLIHRLGRHKDVHLPFGSSSDVRGALERNAVVAALIGSGRDVFLAAAKKIEEQKNDEDRVKEIRREIMADFARERQVEQDRAARVALDWIANGAGRGAPEPTVVETVGSSRTRSEAFGSTDGNHGDTPAHHRQRMEASGSPTILPRPENGHQPTDTEEVVAEGDLLQPSASPTRRRTLLAPPPQPSAHNDPAFASRPQAAPTPSFASVRSPIATSRRPLRQPVLPPRQCKYGCGRESYHSISGNRHVCRFFGEFRCTSEECRNRWNSAYVWSDDGVDEVQTCRICRTDSLPYSKRPLEKGPGLHQGEHETSLCGRCRRLGFDCRDS